MRFGPAWCRRPDAGVEAEVEVVTEARARGCSGPKSPAPKSIPCRRGRQMRSKVLTGVIGSLFTIATVAQADQIGALQTGDEESPSFAQVRSSASADAALTREPLVLTQAHPAQAGPVGPAPAPKQPIGLPRVRDYEPTPELREIYFDFGAAVIRPGDVNILNANAVWLRAPPRYLGQV